mmetsp:Transcript_30746/g.55287  ORF Transcript_30746/g.55287 Transcript_30746/m.55287 type:complete len:204 (-) Transcript_30746:85-696(-)
MQLKLQESRVENGENRSKLPDWSTLEAEYPLPIHFRTYHTRCIQPPVISHLEKKPFTDFCKTHLHLLVFSGFIPPPKKNAVTHQTQRLGIGPASRAKVVCTLAQSVFGVTPEDAAHTAVDVPQCHIPWVVVLKWQRQLLLTIDNDCQVKDHLVGDNPFIYDDVANLTVVNELVLLSTKSIYFRQQHSKLGHHHQRFLPCSQQL